jgi:hypothetical protein
MKQASRTPSFLPRVYKANDGSAAAPSYSFTNNANTGLYTRANFLMATVQGVESAFFSNSTTNGLTVSYGVGFAGGSTETNAADVFLLRDAANTLALRNSTNAQAFRAYNTFTNASNYELATFDWTTSANRLTIGSKAAGTGTQRSVDYDAASHTWKIAGISVMSLDGANFRPEGAGGATIGAAATGWKQLFIDYTNTGTVGAVTINKAAGRVNIAAGATAIVVTNDKVTAASKVFPVPAQADANNPVLRSVVPALGSFTITVSTGPAANQAWDFFVVNTD